MQEQQVKFETFNDGVVFLYSIKDNGDMEEKPKIKLRFGNRVVGETQYYGALAAGIKISRRIRVPLYTDIDEDSTDTFYAVIREKIYQIRRAQHYYNTNPPCTDLTLSLCRERQ